MQAANAIENEISLKAFSQIDLVLLGGAEIPNSLEKKLKLLPNQLVATYGMTETITHIAVRKLNEKNETRDFFVLPGFETSIDERGCLVVNAAHFPGEIITNDMVELQYGKFRWLGRFDNVINSGGLKFFPEELENQIFGLIPYPFIISSLPDEKLGQKMVLVLQAHGIDGQACTQIIDVVNSILKGPKKMHELRILGDFPKTETGKINRKEILIKLLKN
jgi:O-succinylbenzoic acid--CoA ligase